MKTNVTIAVLALTLCQVLYSCGPAGRTVSETAKVQHKPSVDRTLIIYYDKEAGSSALFKKAEELGAAILYHYESLHGTAVVVPEGVSLEAAIADFRKTPGVLSVERDQVMSLD